MNRNWRTATVKSVVIIFLSRPTHATDSHQPIKPTIEEHHQLFGFLNQGSMMGNVNKITDVFKKSLEVMKVCSPIFLYVAQALVKIWHNWYKL